MSNQTARSDRFRTAPTEQQPQLKLMRHAGTSRCDRLRRDANVSIDKTRE